MMKQIRPIRLLIISADSYAAPIAAIASAAAVAFLAREGTQKEESIGVEVEICYERRVGLLPFILQLHHHGF